MPTTLDLVSKKIKINIYLIQLSKWSSILKIDFVSPAPPHVLGMLKLEPTWEVQGGGGGLHV